jgi:hypothetical protein
LRRIGGFWMGRQAPVSNKRKGIALAVAGVADIVQIVLFPMFVEGALSPFEDALDIAVAIALLVILGFRWRLAFAFALELVPGADLFPTWTAVVLSVPSVPAETQQPGAPPPPPALQSDPERS